MAKELTQNEIDALAASLAANIEEGKRLSFEDFSEVAENAILETDYQLAFARAEQIAAKSWGYDGQPTKTLTRSAWESLPLLEQGRFITEGGKLVDDPTPAKVDASADEGLMKFGNGKTISRAAYERLSANQIADLVRV